MTQIAIIAIQRIGKTPTDLVPTNMGGTYVKALKWLLLREGTETRTARVVLSTAVMPLFQNSTWLFSLFRVPMN